MPVLRCPFSFRRSLIFISRRVRAFMGSLDLQDLDAHWDHEPCSADFQSAVSRISNPQAGKQYMGAGMVHGLPTGSRRYSRLETCATRSRFMESIAMAIRLFLQHQHQRGIQGVTAKAFAVKGQAAGQGGVHFEAHDDFLGRCR
jgi:hypothetical protein